MTGRSRVFTLIILGFHAGLVSAQEYETKINLFSGDPKGSHEAGSLTRVGSPVLGTKSGQEASYLRGEQVVIGAQIVPVGLQVHVVAKDAGNGAILVNLTLENSKLIGQKAPQVTSSKAQTTATVQSGSKLRLELGDDPKNKYWVEITIRKAK